MNQDQIDPDYELLAACIRSGQVPDDEVQELMEDQDFARWYREQYPPQPSYELRVDQTGKTET